MPLLDGRRARRPVARPELSVVGIFPLAAAAANTSGAGLRSHTVVPSVNTNIRIPIAQAGLPQRALILLVDIHRDAHQRVSVFRDTGIRIPRQLQHVDVQRRREDRQVRPDLGQDLSQWLVPAPSLPIRVPQGLARTPLEVLPCTCCVRGEVTEQLRRLICCRHDVDGASKVQADADLRPLARQVMQSLPRVCCAYGAQRRPMT
mmetsp:Transcript_39418/g.111777  ORF Transcript_39418/g.111777 Transcript_39418/m.111777 type:complete len:204 (+) Transcript_39418:713-1324(+)